VGEQDQYLPLVDRSPHCTLDLAQRDAFTVDTQPAQHALPIVTRIHLVSVVDRPRASD
jgi:hypothetical protein